MVVYGVLIRYLTGTLVILRSRWFRDTPSMVSREVDHDTMTKTYYSIHDKVIS